MNEFSRKYDAVIFDMDGVLIDSQPLHYQVDMEVVKKIKKNSTGENREVTLEDVKKCAGMSNPNRFEKYIKDYNLQITVDELTKIHVSTLDELVEKTNLEPIDAIVNLLEFLKQNNYKTAVASSSSKTFIKYVVKRVGIEKYFDLLVSGEELKNSKPAPDIFLETARQLQTPTHKCIVIEDSGNGVLASYNAKIKCVGYINPNSGTQDLSKADLIIENFKQLLEDKSWIEK